MKQDKDSRYRWFIIILAAFTNVFVVGMPQMCMPVLFKEISKDLGLNLLQLGAVWGMSGLAGMFACMAGGLVGDRYGTKRTVSLACLLAGFTGAARGLSNSFFGLIVTMFLFGILMMTLTLNIHKSAGVWFKGRQVVMANGIVATGIALGFMAGAMISDTVLSPMLGGWKNVLFLYGAVSVIFGLIWTLTRRESSQAGASSSTSKMPFREIFFRVVRIRNTWLIAIGNMCYTGCLMGLTGYMPLYLRGAGWNSAVADGVLAAFNGAGMIAAIPLTLFSRQLDSKKKILIPFFIIVFISIGLLSVVDGAIIWLLMILAGITRDAYYAIIATMVIETEQIGIAIAGTAIGFVWSLGNLGYFICPPIGNALAGYSPGWAFIFWSLLALASLFSFRAAT